MKYLLLAFHIFTKASLAEIPQSYEKKGYTLEKTYQVGDHLFFHYGFKDHLGAFREFKWGVEKLNAESFMYNFGLNEKEGDSFQVGTTELEYSMMKNVGGKLVFDYEKIIEESKPLISPLYLEFKNIVSKYQLSRREKIELVLRFLQDIPYGIPPTNYKNRYIAGLFPPIEVLSNTWGDCDSKSLLMATLLSFDREFYDKLAIILVPGHALLGIQLVPGPYEKFMEYRGKSYVYAEPVGLSRTPLGVTNSPYSIGVQVFPLKLYPPLVNLPVVSEIEKQNSVEACPDGGLSVEYDHPFKKEHIKSCQKKINGAYQKHGPTKIFNLQGQLLETEFYSLGQKI